MFGAYDHRKFSPAGIPAQIGLSVVGEYERLLVSSLESLVCIAILVMDDNENTSSKGCLSLRGNDNRVSCRPVAGANSSHEFYGYAHEEFGIRK